MNRRFPFDIARQEFGRASRGNVAVIFALAALPLLVGVGVAIDYAKSANVRTHLQSTLDAAVLAGARESSPSAQIAKAQSFFDAQRPEQFSAKTSASFSVADHVLNGTAQAEVPTSIMAMFGRETLDVSAKAAAASSSGGKVCILLVDQSRSQTLLANSGAKLIAPDCEIHVRTNVSPGAIINAGVNLDVKRTCVKASTVINNGGSVGNLEKSCDAISDPYAGKMPSVSIPGASCKSENYNPDVSTVVLPAGNYCNVNFSNQTSVTLNPGMYGGMNFNQARTVKLNPGLYIVKGGNWNVNSGMTFTGTGVTIYYADNSIIQFNGNVNVQLSAPTSGSYDDILFYEAPGLSQSNWVINGTSSSTLRGLIYLPSKAVTINSVSNVSADKATMVFASLILNNTNWTITPGNKAMASSSGGAVRLLY
ncbi:TadE/TadG family type IV pilus assembly protein [Pseudorhodoplanes sinuspersici]|uniref:Uncharacterized protein n=1 Tax=Pseudorhodoplanes sinuspersici TaxID=1235591 RepID=A0A1W6ZSU7_9HYPH|nr:Tad domain-containing protein [Pseudorhodoplanes sinuspersici]ARQ00440.1 hypothetical protein CAK95_16150 [Pseudorhodoplanes sinuspersici]RKE67389.1 Flp pilus assembly protein TadG [Pseudorhodoplanes sinuspersici]